MGYLSKRDTITVNLGNNYYVVMQELSQDDASKVESILASSVQARQEAVNSRNNKIEMSMPQDGTIGRWRMEQVARSIIEWNLDNEDGVVVPYETNEDKLKFLRKMPLKDFNLLHQVSEELNTNHETEEDKANAVKFRESVSLDNSRQFDRGESGADASRVTGISNS